MHKKKELQIIFAILLVPRTGLEPAHLAELPPEDSVSTNFTTWALMAQNYVCFFIEKGLTEKTNLLPSRPPNLAVGIAMFDIRCSMFDVQYSMFDLRKTE